ncbi:NAD(P)H-dependent oxidoreductase [Streptomyces sp. NPDC026673]|uniref:flavodoxin family protein n=1 Tax=Streptomyces sp. NPDC026673 TaxID=3155724 RepID=UPI0033E3FAF8
MSDSERTFLFLVGSSRADGNTETLARRAAEQLPPAVRRRWIRLKDLPLPLFADERHNGDGSYPPPAGHAATLLEATLEATDLVVVSPLYWYSVSTSTKLYLDHWSGWMRVPGVDFLERMRGKTLWSVTVLGGQDPATAAPLVGTLRHTAAYAGMRWGGALLGNGTRPGDVLRDTAALSRAKTFFG